MTLSESILTTWLEAHHEAAGNAVIKMVSGKELRMMAWAPHNRANSGLLEMAWLDPRGQAAMTEGDRLTQLYPPASCFCSEVHTESHIYYCNGEYLDADNGEPIKDLIEEEISISNVVCDSSKLLGYNGSESLY